jgi:hypothetical protein
VARDYFKFYFTYIPAVPGVVLWMSLWRMSFSQLGEHGTSLESVREQLVSQRLRKYLVWKNNFVFYKAAIFSSQYMAKIRFLI